MPANKSEVWESERIQLEVVNDLKGGASYSFIQAKYKTSPKVILKIKKKFGLHIRPTAKKDATTRIKSMVKNGYLLSEIAHAVKMSQDDVSGIISALKLKKGSKQNRSNLTSVRCKCPGCGTVYYRKMFAQYPERVQYLYGEVCCNKKMLSEKGYSQTVPTQRCQAKGV